MNAPTTTILAPFDDDLIEAYFAQELDYQIWRLEQETGFQESEWFPAGPKGSQDRQWWLDNGPPMIRGFLEWYDSHSDVEVWTTPDGRPAVELELTVKFGEIPVHMFVDLILRIGSALVVVDLKSGSKRPENYSQLGIYASGVELAFGQQYRPRYGTFYMLRGVGRDPEARDYFLTPVELGGYEYSVDWWTHEFTKLDQAVESGIFLASPGQQCGRCGVAYACPAVGGRDSWRFDEGARKWREAA